MWCEVRESTLVVLRNGADLDPFESDAFGSTDKHEKEYTAQGTHAHFYQAQ